MAGRRPQRGKEQMVGRGGGSGGGAVFRLVNKMYDARMCHVDGRWVSMQFTVGSIGEDSSTNYRVLSRLVCWPICCCRTKQMVVRLRWSGTLLPCDRH